MSVLRGVWRLVLIRSAVYDYAEVDIQSPVHLVADNNAGKTSLIAALQFLFIDDLRQMTFSKSLGETKRFYFTSGSLILFECMTRTGLQVFGVRGLGPARGFECERFAYNGHFERADFLDDRTPRNWRDIRNRLIDRNLRLLKPQHLRASLTLSGDSKGAPLGLLPFRQSSNYDSFKFLFRSLLRLSQVGQDKLKSLFIDICGPRLPRVEIDIRHDYGALFEEAVQQGEDIEALEGCTTIIEDVLELAEKIGSLRGLIRNGWKAINTEFASLKRESHKERARIGSQLEDLSSQFEALDGELEQVVAREAERNQRLGAIDASLKKLEELQNRVASFLPEFEETHREALAERIEALTGRLSDARQGESGATTRRLAAIEATIRKDRRLVEHYEDTVIAWLRRRSGLTDTALEELFSVLDPTLLSEVLGSGRVVIEGEEQAVNTLAAVYGHFDSGVLLAPGLRVEERRGSSRLSEFQDLDSVNQRILDDSREHTRLTQLLADIRVRDQLKSEVDNLKHEQADAVRRFNDWEDWQEGEPEMGRLRNEKAKLGQDLASDGRARKGIQDRKSILRSRMDALTREKLGIDEHVSRIRSQVETLSPPPAEWPTLSAADAPSGTLEELIAAYQNSWSEEKDSQQRLQTMMSRVATRTNERYQRSSERETLRALRDALSALEDQRKAAQELWASLLDSMGNAFKLLRDSVQEVARTVRRLNRSLQQRQVSNLKEVRLTVAHQEELFEQLGEIIEVGSVPLLVPSSRRRAIDTIRSWFTVHPQLTLEQLFDLRIEVTTASGRQESYDSLAEIESQGTSTTLKVLLHLELLRQLFVDQHVALPFFLDEVATLDDANLRSLIAHATSMGFVPIVASPQARDCVGTLYFVPPDANGRVVLDERARVTVERAINED